MSLLSINVYAQEKRGRLHLSTDLGLWLKDSKANIYFAYQFKGAWYIEGGCSIDINDYKHEESISLGNWLMRRDKGGLKCKFEVINQSQSGVDLRVGLSYQIYILKGIFIDTGITYPLLENNTINIILKLGWEF